ncbi:MAG: hypothetical protein JO352_21050 [Chloroflexi bacterium]|nr:hypothetical protein [Chloroflexota bacterium]MBV9596422.1 hypothetical protein [Chloroflexota bacterium]
MIEGLYDPDAAAQGAASVRWFIGSDANGEPQFCGLAAHHTCPHRMDCSRCGLFISGERAKLVHGDPSLLRVTAEIPMTKVQRLLNEGQREAAARALKAAKEISAPVPPSDGIPDESRWLERRASEGIGKPCNTTPTNK